MSISTDPNDEPDITEIDVEKLKRMQMLHIRFLIFDTRSKDDYEKNHIPAALHISFDGFLDQFTKMVTQKDMPVVLYDEAGLKTAALITELEKTGYYNVVSLKGGYQAFTSIK